MPKQRPSPCAFETTCFNHLWIYAGEARQEKNHAERHLYPKCRDDDAKRSLVLIAKDRNSVTDDHLEQTESGIVKPAKDEADNHTGDHKRGEKKRLDHSHPANSLF